MSYKDIQILDMQLTDQIGRLIKRPKRIETIISLVPSISHILCYLGYQDQIVGRTKFCIYPEDLQAQKLGGTKNPKIELIKELNADIIFMNKEENRKEDVLALAEDTNVYVSDINNMVQLQMFLDDIGEILDCTPATNQFKEAIQVTLDQVKNKFPPAKFLYFIWKSPYYLAGSSTYINSIFEHIGWENQVIKQENHQRYPELEYGQWHDEVDYILLSSEPYPFQTRHINEMQKKFPKAKIKLVSGEVFSWYGPFLFDLEKSLIQITN